MEAVVKQARTTRHAWLIAGDANMCPEDIEKSLWFQTCSSRRQGKPSQLADQKAHKGKLIERTYGYVVASRSLQEKIRSMEVVEDFESRPHKAVSFVVERVKKSRNGVNKKCLKHHQASVLGSCQEEVKQKKAKKKRMKRRRVRKQR